MDFGDVLEGWKPIPPSPPFLGCDYTPFDPKTYLRTKSVRMKLSLVIEVGNSDSLWT